MAEKNKEKESVLVKLARIEENIKNFREIYEKDHRELINGQEKLCNHVNDENSKMDTRITSLEQTRIENDASKKGEIRVYKYATAILAITLTTLTIITIIQHLISGII